MVEALDKIQGFERATEGAARKDHSNDNTSTEGNNNNESSEDQRKRNADTGAGEKQMISAAVPGNTADSEAKTDCDVTTEPILSNPRIGNPISHGQVVDLSQKMKAQTLQPCRLEDLLKGVRMYIPPPAPKPEPVRIFPQPGRCDGVVWRTSKLRHHWGKQSLMLQELQLDYLANTTEPDL